MWYGDYGDITLYFQVSNPKINKKKRDRRGLEICSNVELVTQSQNHNVVQIKTSFFFHVHFGFFLFFYLF